MLVILHEGSLEKIRRRVPEGISQKCLPKLQTKVLGGILKKTVNKFLREPLQGFEEIHERTSEVVLRKISNTSYFEICTHKFLNLLGAISEKKNLQKKNNLRNSLVKLNLRKKIFEIKPGRSE